MTGKQPVKYLMPTVYRLVLAAGGILFLLFGLFGDVRGLWLSWWAYRAVYVVVGVAVVAAAFAGQYLWLRKLGAFAALTGGVFRAGELVNQHFQVGPEASPLLGALGWLYIGGVLASMCAFGWVYHRGPGG